MSDYGLDSLTLYRKNIRQREIRQSRLMTYVPQGESIPEGFGKPIRHDYFRTAFAATKLPISSYGFRSRNTASFLIIIKSRIESRGFTLENLIFISLTILQNSERL